MAAMRAPPGSRRKRKIKDSTCGEVSSPLSVQQMSSPGGVEWLDDVMMGDTQKDHNIAAAGTTGITSVGEYRELLERESLDVYLPHCSSDSELCEQIGISTDALEELRKSCNPQSLLSGPQRIDKDSPLFHIHSPRKLVHYLDKLDHTSISYSNIIYDHSNKAQNTPVDTKEIVLCIDIFHPAKTMREQHFVVLGSQKLTELRDKIVCSNDYYCTEELSSDPAALDEDTDPSSGPTNVSKSAYFFIANHFYDDMRHPEAKEMSRNVISWSEEGDRIAKSSRLDNFDAHLMEVTTFEMLQFRLGWPYLYCHHGNCNHLVIFRDMRLFNVRIDPPFLEQYPRLLYYNKALIKKQLCHVCNKDATWVTVDDEFSSGNGSHSFFCHVCFVKLHYTAEGEKVNRVFKAYRYHAPDPPTVIA